MNEGCPCESVRELKITVEKHENQLNKGETSFALISKDLEYIKARLDEKKKFNTQTLSNIVQAICSLLVAVAAAKLGLQ